MGGRWIEIERSGSRGPIPTVYEYTDAYLPKLLLQRPRGRPQKWPGWQLAHLLTAVALFMIGHFKDAREYEQCRLSSAGDEQKREAAFRFLVRAERSTPALFPNTTESAIRKQYREARRRPDIVRIAESMVPEIKGRL